MVHSDLTVSQVPLTVALANQNALISSLVVPRHRPRTGDDDDNDEENEDVECTRNRTGVSNGKATGHGPPGISTMAFTSVR